MFRNPGSKIKVTAIVLFILSLLAEIIFAFVLKNIWYVFIFAAPIVTWVSCLVMYGFGELIESASFMNSQNYSSSKIYNSYDRKEQLDKLLEQGLIDESEYKEALSKNG